MGITAADFNEDGRPDLAVSCHLSGDLVELINRGDGTFCLPVSLGRIGYPGAVIAADLSGDGHIDLAEASLTENVVRVLFGDGTGKIIGGGDYASGVGYPARGVAADFNGDGFPDLAIGCQGQLAVFFGDGGFGAFGPRHRYSYPGTYVLGTDDFDGDGAPDLVAAGGDAAGFSLYLNRQGGSFLPPLAIPGPGDRSKAVLVGDFNGDGRPDVITWNENAPHLSVYLNNTSLPHSCDPLTHPRLSFRYRGCDSVTGTVTLTAAAPAGGATVALASNNPAAALPAQVSIPEGALQARFTVPVAASVAHRWAFLTASYNGTAKHASLLIRPMGAPQLTIDPAQVTGGQSAMGRVTIACPAGPDGVTIRLSNSSPSVSVPASVTVPAGATTVAFPILTYKVAAASTATISAGAPGTAVTALLRLLPPPTPPSPPAPPAPGLALVLFPNPVPGGMLALGQVTLVQPAGAGGATIALAGSSPAAVVPATVAVFPGTSTATFPIITFAVSQPTAVTITAAGTGGAATATLQLLPLGPVTPVPPLAGVRLLVSSHNNNSVLRYDGQTGALVDTFVPPGSGGLEGPHGLAVGPDGNLYVANRFHRSVLRFNGQTGAFIDAFVPPGSGGLDIPIGLAFGPDGGLYVSSYGTDQVLRYDGRTGAFLGVFVPARSAGLRQPYALLFGPDGNLYVCSQGVNGVYQFDGRTGGFMDLFVAPGSGGLNGPNGLAFGPDGQLYVSSWQTHSILRYDGRTGGFLDVFVPSHSGGLTEPWDLKFGPDGNLYVASAGSDQVLRYDGRTGAFLGAFAAGAGLSRPDWLLFVPPAAPGPPPLSVTPLFINGAAYVPTGPSETLTATFTRPDGGVTAAGYKGYVLLRVTGVGQSYGATYNDAFYLYSAPFNAPQNGHDGGYYQLTFGTNPLQAFSLASNARNFLAGPLPAYNPAHDYTFVLDTRLAHPGRLRFGVSDGGYNDNTGAYTITVTQLVPGR